MSLDRATLRKLKPSESRSEAGVVYTRLDGDGRWSINIMVNRRRFHHVVGLESEGFTKTQALDIITSLRAEKHTRKHGVASPKKNAVTVADAAKMYTKYLRETGGKDVEKKDERLRLHIVPLIGGLQLATLTTADMKRYSTKRVAQGASAGTINRELAVMSHLLRTASDADALSLISTLPCRIPRLKEAQSKTVYLTPAQANALLETAAKDSSPHTHAFAMIGLHTGMRYSSILAIRIQDIDFAHRVIWVEKDKTGERQQPITGELATYLERFTKGAESQWLFPSAKSKTGHAVNVRKAWRRVIAECGLQKIITPHTMRHTMASNASHAGVDGATLQAMGGWKSRRMVERYTHPGAMREAMDKLSSAYANRGRVTPKLHGRSRKTA